MSERKARATRQELRAQGIDPDNMGPGPNLTDLPDTREQRRTKRFRKRAFAVQEKQASILDVFKHRIKWAKAYSKIPTNS